ncbi:MAG TPA: serine protease [Tardiphaga sp.]
MRGFVGSAVRLAIVPAAAVCFLIVAVLPVQSEGLLPTRIEMAPVSDPKPLTRTILPPQSRTERSGTGFFVDDIGHVLTARHVVEGCSRIVIEKEGRSSSARVVALSTPFDLALLHTSKTRGLAAVFPRTTMSSTNDIVFAADHQALAAMISRGGMLFNASVSTTSGSGEAGHIALISTMTFGSSGAPVLDSRGLVEGVVSRKTAINRVLAVGAAGAKAFLGASNVRFQEDDRPQISGSGSRAHRAASISARIVCLN